MDFDFTDEQALLRQSVERFVADRYGFEARRAILASGPGWSRVIWNGLAELGVTALTVPEEHGGLGGGPVETMLAMAALGEGLVVEPVLASAVIATELITASGDATAEAALLPALASGERIFAPALYERGARYDAGAPGTRARRIGAGYGLDGDKLALCGGGAADAFLVSARLDEGLALFLVEAGAPGLLVQRERGYDGTPVATLAFDDLRLAASARIGGEAGSAIRSAIDIAVAALAAEAVGVMRRAVALTADYLRTRQQFGRPIGAFQALQHACVDMFVASEEAWSAALLAAGRCRDADPTRRRKAIAAAKVTINKSARLVGQKAIQLHGGVGMTDEYAISHYFRRLTAIERQFGDADHWLKAYAQA
ncbi:MAG: acyl-CoA dehydrogenase family protein [Methylobacteriaceae bacterium]|nr:acyl-CoA dehydrogenase family protein [Methylobacteriaceae bacterium]